MASVVAATLLQGRTMSLLDALGSTLSDMGFVQLALFFLVVSAYSVAINGAYGPNLRSGAASASFAAAAAFSALSTSWMGGIVFLAIAVLAVAAFAGATWAMSALLGFGPELVIAAESIAEERAPEEPVPTRVPVPQAVRSLAPTAVRAQL
jgi:hypothetical protein